MLFKNIQAYNISLVYVLFIDGHKPFINFPLLVSVNKVFTKQEGSCMQQLQQFLHLALHFILIRFLQYKCSDQQIYILSHFDIFYEIAQELFINHTIKAMKLLVLLSLLLVFTTSANWAILVAGSNTYSNYRHQSDIFHANYLLRKNNFDPEKIITFAYDDIANSRSNPFKGKVFNKPTYKEPGVDVYEGVKIDYSGKYVTPQVFLSVLQGNKAAVKGKGSERVLESTPQDNVFLYFADHGAPGLIAFPSEYLHADKLQATFNKMNGKYNKFVFYLQACESGSMFTKLPSDTKIYALSAANPSESSWGTYCSPNDVVQGKHIGSCLGDLFSINFLEDSDSEDLSKETLQTQFEVIKKLTTKSHVMQWGDLSFKEDVIGEYITGDQTPSDFEPNSIINLRRSINALWKSKRTSTVDSRYAKIEMLTSIYKRQKTPKAFKEMKEEMKSMQRFDKIFAPLVKNLGLSGEYDAYNIQFDCMRSVIEQFENKHGRLSDYALIYVKYIAEACESQDSQKIGMHL